MGGKRTFERAEQGRLVAKKNRVSLSVMVDADRFRHFLERQYPGAKGTPLSPRPISDYISRCRRVETLLRVDLDREQGSAEHVVRRIEGLSDRVVNIRVKRGLQTAVRCYYEFRHRRR
jgi:hypothetical protein